MDYDFTRYRRSNSTKNKINYFLYILSGIVFGLVVIYSLVNLVYLSFSYAVMFHNVDLSYNMCLISNDLCQIDIENEKETTLNTTNYREWKDQPLTGDPIGYSDSYRSSSGEQMTIFFKFGFFCFTFSYGLISLVYMIFALSEEIYKIKES